MTTRAISTIVCAAALASLAPRAARASAADAFENKIKPVSGQAYQKGGRLELSPTFGLSLNDAFYNKYMGGAKLDYHINEYVSAGVLGLYGTTSTTGSTTICETGKPCTNAGADQLNQVPGEIKWIVGAQVAFSPVYGKLNFFGLGAVHFDLSVLAGGDLVAYRGVLRQDQILNGVTPGTVTTPGGHFGLGTRLFFGRFMALRLEIKDLIYSVEGLATGKLQNQLFFDAGLSFFIPVATREAP